MGLTCEHVARDLQTRVSARPDSVYKLGHRVTLTAGPAMHLEMPDDLRQLLRVRPLPGLLHESRAAVILEPARADVDSGIETAPA